MSKEFSPFDSHSMRAEQISLTQQERDQMKENRTGQYFKWSVSPFLCPRSRSALINPDKCLPNLFLKTFTASMFYIRFSYCFTSVFLAALRPMASCEENSPPLYKCLLCTSGFAMSLFMLSIGVVLIFSSEVVLSRPEVILLFSWHLSSPSVSLRSPKLNILLWLQLFSSRVE